MVDDNQTSQEMLRTALESFSFQVTGVSTGMAGLIEVSKMHQEEKPFDLLLLDWHMPSLDGIQTFRCLSSLASPSDIPTIFMVPRQEQLNVKHGMGKHQPGAYLDKPVQISVLFDTIMKLFGKEQLLPMVERRKAALTLHPGKVICNARVLLVEDNEINQQVGRELLAMVGIVVEIANNGQEAVQKVAEMDFDLLLMDIQMPVLDGYQATREIRQTHRGTKLPIVAMTANIMVQDLARCREVGMDDYVTKPIDPEKLFRVLSKWIKFRDNESGKQNNLMDKEYRKEVPFPILPGIDTKSGLFHVGGNVKLFGSLLGKFRENHARCVAEIQVAMDKGETQQVHRMAHTVKGLAGTIGALRLQSLAAKLESSLLFPPDFESELALVSDSIGQLLSMLPEESIIPPPVTSAVNPVVLLKTLTLLNVPLEKRRPKRCQLILKELQHMAFPSGMERDMDNLTGLIKIYRMKEAIHILNMMEVKLKRLCEKEG